MSEISCCLFLLCWAYELIDCMFLCPEICTICLSGILASDNLVTRCFLALVFVNRLSILCHLFHDSADFVLSYWLLLKPQIFCS
jgi:hypothetical protein